VAISPTLTPNLRLRLTNDLTADAKYNLRRIDDLGSRFVVGQDGSTYVRAINDIYIEPESPDVSGTGIGGLLQLGDPARAAADMIDVEIWSRSLLIASPVGMKDQAPGDFYLNLQYNSDADGGGVDGADRALVLDVQGADRTIILGGNLITGGDVTFDMSAPGTDSITVGVEGTRTVTLAGNVEVAAGTFSVNPSSGLRTLTMSADLQVATPTLLTGGTGLTVTTTGTRSLAAVVNGDIVTADGAQTLTNKVIDADANDITNIRNANVAANAQIEVTKLEALNPSHAAQFDSSGYLESSSVTNTELSYLSGVTSSIQTQLNTKAHRALNNLQVTGLAAGSLLVGSSSTAVENLAIGPYGSVLRSDGVDLAWDYPVGTGDVVGPVSATDHALARFDGTTGKVIQSSTGILTDAGALSGLISASLTNGSYSVILAPSGAQAAHYTFTLPPTPGPAGNFLMTDGVGVTTWESVPQSLQEAYDGGNTIDTTGGLPVEISKTDPGGRALYVHHDANASGPGGAALLVERITATGYALSVNSGDNNNTSIYQAPTAADAATTIEVIREAGFASVNPVLQVFGPSGDIQLQLTDGISTANFVADSASQALTISTIAAAPAANSDGVVIKSGAADGGTSGPVTLFSGDQLSGSFPSGDVSLASGFQFGTSVSGNVGLSTGFNFGTGASGAIFLSTGSTTLSGDSGGISLFTGNPGESTSASGGISIQTGDGLLGGDTGTINITTGFTATETTGSINLIAGNSIAGTIGGNVSIAAMTRDAASGGTAGGISISAGSSVNAGLGGSLTLSAGSSANAGNAGSSTIIGGDASGSGDGGTVTLQAGGSDSGDGGNVTLSPGGSNTGATGTIGLGGTTILSGASGTPIQLRFTQNDVPFSTYVALQAPTSPTTHTMTLPSTAGSDGQVLKTDASGNLAFQTMLSATGATPISSDVTLTNRRIHLVNTGAARSLALPAPHINLYIVVKDSDGAGANVNNITITRPGAQTIDSVAASYVMNASRQSITIISDGANYFII
jgi:hypothetical protein